MKKPPKRLLDQVREQIRLRHYSIRTEQAYASKNLDQAEIEQLLTPFPPIIESFPTCTP